MPTPSHFRAIVIIVPINALCPDRMWSHLDSSVVCLKGRRWKSLHDVWSCRAEWSHQWLAMVGMQHAFLSYEPCWHIAKEKPHVTKQSWKGDEETNGSRAHDFQIRIMLGALCQMMQRTILVKRQFTPTSFICLWFLDIGSDNKPQELCLCPSKGCATERTTMVVCVWLEIAFRIAVSTYFPQHSMW